MASKSFGDYELDDGYFRNAGGNGVDNEVNLQLHDYDATENSGNNNFNKIGNNNGDDVKMDSEKSELIFNGIDNRNKKNVLSALRAKIRRSDMLTDAEEKYKFAPVLSVGNC